MKLSVLSRAIAGLCLVALATAAPAQTVINSNPDAFPIYKGTRAMPVLCVDSTGAYLGCSGPIPAGTNLIGKVGIDQTTPGTTNKVNAGGTTTSVCVTPTITAGTYTSGQELGPLMTFSNVFGAAGSGVLQSIAITSKTKQASGTVRFYPFSSNPSNSTWTDHATPAIAAADVASVRTPVDFATAYSDLGTHTIWGAIGLGEALAPGTTTLYGVLVATSAMSAFGSTSDIQVCVKTLAD